MVAANRAAVAEAAQRARHLVETLDLTPPVDVAQLISERANVEYVDWSHSCDAVTSLSHEPPRVFVRQGATPLRERFTLAHELGHIELAWHVGTVDCVTDSAREDDEVVFPQKAAWAQEQEANEFASRLLVPDRWVSPLVSGRTHFTHEEMRDILAHLAEANVSALAGVIALRRHLLPGHAFFVGDRFAVSDGTPWPGYPPLTIKDISDYLAGAYEVGEFEHQGRTVKWALMLPMVDVPQPVDGDSHDTRKAHEVLTDCCSDVFGDDAPARVYSINGIVGAVTRNASLGWQEGSIITAVHARINERIDLRAILDHPEFMLYLRKRANGIVERRGKKGSART
ncbi:ImmA/IrrE family metallo-endopeptidase [Streptomyces sp. NPDC001812]|uniref:ImmA/IrrE family metallo-endopeptidase n=1 Tax=Streptomyces sp. NPDC001812 TaxID=3364611 RepID=UPI0036CAB9CA